MNQKEKARIKKRIKEMKASLTIIDNSMRIKQNQIVTLQNQVNMLLQRKISITGGIIELNRLLPEDERDPEFIVQEEPQLKKESNDES